MKKRVLCLICDGVEELELIAPVDLLRRAGAEVTGRNGIQLTADSLLGDVDGYDLFLLPGGPGVRKLRQDGRAAEIARRFVEAGKPVAAICAAPTVLHDAGLLEGKRFTAFPAVRKELVDAVDERVVEDGLVITSRGAGTAVDFALALVARLFESQRAQVIVTEIAG